MHVEAGCRINQRSVGIGGRQIGREVVMTQGGRALTDEGSGVTNERVSCACYRIKKRQMRLFQMVAVRMIGRNTRREK